MIKLFFKSLCYVLSVLAFSIIPKVTYGAEVIKSFNTVTRINSGGQIYVQEKILYDFGSEERHGIFREIPYLKSNKEGKEYQMDISEVSVKNGSGTGQTFTLSADKYNGILTIKIGDADKLISGEHVYEINYVVSGALTYFEDHDELYWNFTGNDWDVPIETSINNVLLPTNIPLEQINIVCYSGAYNSDNSKCLVEKTENGLIFSMQSLQANEGVTGVVGFPKGYVSILEAEEVKPEFFSTFLIYAVPGLKIYWYIILPIMLFRKRLSYKKYFLQNEREVAAWFDPPKDENYEYYTPAEAGVLIDKTPDQKEITATIIHMAQRGHFKILEDKGELYFVKNTEPLKDRLRDFELLLFDGIFEKADIVNTSSLKKSLTLGKNVQTFMTSIVEVLEKKDLFVGDLSNEKGKQTAFLIFSILTVNILLLIITVYYHKHYIKFTEKGIEKYSKTASLKNFLASQDAQLDFQAQNMMFFEKLLPYATAFGVEDIWAKRFKNLGEIKTDWYNGNLANTVALSNISHSIDKFVSASSAYYTSTTSSSGHSSGFSGGFSGGGGGGGGGGSW